jgi:two-component system, response regulator YesN
MKKPFKLIFKKMKTVMKYNVLKTYFIVVVALALQSLFMYSFYDNVLKKHTSVVNNILLKNSIDKIENDILELEKIAIVLNSNSRVTSFFGVGAELTNVQAYQAVQIVKDLKAIKDSNRLIENIFIVFSNGIVLYSDGKYSIQFFQENIDPEFEKIVSSFNEYSYRKLLVTGGKKAIENQILYLQSLPFGNKKNMKATLLIQLSKKYLGNILENNKLTKSTVSVLAFSDGKNKTDIQIGPDGSVNNEFDSIRKADGIISQFQSDIFGLELNTITPRKEFNMHKIYIKGVLFYAMIFTIGIFILFTFNLAYKDYKKILSIYNKVSGYFRGRTVSNIFDYIKYSINDIVDENTVLRDEKEKNADALKEYTFGKILGGQITDNLYHYMEVCGMHLVNKEYVLFAVIPSNGFSKKAFYLQHVFKKYFSDINDFFTCINNKNGLIVLGVDDINHERILSIGEILSEIFEREFDSDTIVGISNKMSNIKSISTAYQEALEAVRYGTLYRIKCVAFGAMQGNKDNQVIYHYSLETEQKLINYIKTGNINNIRNVLADIYNDNFAEKRLSYNKVKLLIMDLINTVVKTTEDIGLTVEQSIYRIAVENVSIENAFKKIEEYYINIGEYCLGHKKSNNHQLFDKIVDYLEKNYMNDQLCLNLIANHLNLSANYLSQFFKEQAGMYFKDYINMLRIKKAKEIIESSENVKMYEVAANVGYKDNATLIRVFKRYLGVTPGEYKEEEFANT